MVYISIITSVVMALVVVGFLLGFLRNWKKSLIRGCMILGSLIASIFLAPVISSWLLDKFVIGTSFVGFGLSVDVENIVRDIVGDGEFVIDFNALSSKLVPVLLNRYLNALCDTDYKTDEHFLDKLYYLNYYY